MLTKLIWTRMRNHMYKKKWITTTLKGTHHFITNKKDGALHAASCYALLSNIILWNNNSKNLKLNEACVSTKKRVIIYLKIKECNVDNSLEIDCGPQNDTFLIGEADGQQTNYQICLKHLHWHMILFDH